MEDLWNDINERWSEPWEIVMVSGRQFVIWDSLGLWGKAGRWR